MAAGGQAQINTTTLNAQINALVQNAFDSLDACRRFKAWIDGPGGGAAGLLTVPAGPSSPVYVAPDNTNIFNAFADLKQLNDIAIGAANLAVAKDFRTNARLVGSTQIP